MSELDVVPYLVALLGGGLVAAAADFMRARREGKAQPSSIEATIAVGAKDAVASLKIALDEANSRADRLESSQRELRTELMDVRRRCDDHQRDLAEARRHASELERSNAGLRDRIRLLEATVETLRRTS